MAKHLAKFDVPQYLWKKNIRKAQRRKHRLLKIASAITASKQAFAAQFGKQSAIVKMLANGLPPDKDIARKGRLNVTIPSSFSIIDNPESALATLSGIARQMRSHRLGSMFLDFRKMSQYDLGANALLDVLVEELSIQARLTHRKIRWRGTYPEDSGNRRFLKAMGVIKRLKIEHEYPTKEEERKLELFDTRCKHYVRVLHPRHVDKKGRVTGEFADHINRCLSSVGKSLSPESRGRLCQYVSEIIDNAEQHSGMFDWTIQGYLDTHLPTPMCEIAIFNFGRTIANSFEELPSDSYTHMQVKRYIDLHKKRNFFQTNWRERDLYTLIALQGSVSSKNLSATDTRGNGTVDLIDFFQKIHVDCSNGDKSTSARMVIVSGSTYILFDGTYSMVENSDGVSVMAFNADNDLSQKPDSKFVRKIDGVNFPGTLISIKFPLSVGVSVTKESGDLA